MSWNVEAKEHYENVSKTYDVLSIISNDELTLKDALREVIVEEMKLSCQCIVNCPCHLYFQQYALSHFFILYLFR